jgi:hypothetical protein
VFWQRYIKENIEDLENLEELGELLKESQADPLGASFF